MICFELYIDGRCVKKRSCTRRLFGRRSTEAVIFHTFNRVTRAAFIISALSTAAQRRLRSAQMLTETRKSTPRERNRTLLGRVGQKTPRLPLVSQAEVPRWWKSLPWERCVFGRHLPRLNHDYISLRGCWGCWKASPSYKKQPTAFK